MGDGSSYGLVGVIVLQMFQLLGGAELGKIFIEYLRMKMANNEKINDLELKHAINDLKSKNSILNERLKACRGDIEAKAKIEQRLNKSKGVRPE